MIESCFSKELIAPIFTRKKSDTEKMIHPIYPNSQFKSFWYSKSIITRPNIILGVRLVAKHWNPANFHKRTTRKCCLFFLLPLKSKHWNATRIESMEKPKKKPGIPHNCLGTMTASSVVPLSWMIALRYPFRNHFQRIWLDIIQEGRTTRFLVDEMKEGIPTGGFETIPNPQLSEDCCAIRDKDQRKLYAWIHY